jgi:hypothetical protein
VTNVILVFGALELLLEHLSLGRRHVVRRHTSAPVIVDRRQV